MTGDVMLFGTSTTEAFRIDSSQNLLVGKTADNVATVGIEARATGPLISTRDGSDALRLNRLNSDGEIIQLRKDGTTVGSINATDGDLAIMSTTSSHKGLRFGSGAITPTTNTGGTDDAATDLGGASLRFKDGYFNGTLHAGRFAGKSDTNTYIDFQGSDVMQFFTGGSERARFDASGSFLIGRTSAGFTSETGTTIGPGFIQCERNGTLGFYNRTTDGTLMDFRRSNSTKGSISANSSGVTYNTTSDRRLKSNIQDSASASDKIDAIQVRQFDWNADNSHQDYGLIAQELQPIEPMAVTGNADSDEMMGVDYSKLVPMLIKEIQQLRGRVAALEAS
tara:strand:- start:36 stop:1046 length:1011 start_codon:yes stop_codon:yes gene_type:complete